MRRRAALNRRQRAQERHEIGDIAGVHALIGRVGKRRVIMLALWRYAGQQRVGEIDGAPGADAVDRIA